MCIRITKNLKFKLDEQNCAQQQIGSPCRHSEYRCSSGNQCIPKAFHCDKVREYEKLSVI